MSRLGLLVVRHRVAIVVAAVVGMALAFGFGRGVASRLSSGGFEDPGSESVRAARILEEEFAVRPPTVVIVATAPGGSVDDPAAVGAGVALVRRLSVEPGVTQVTSYWTLGSPPSLRSAAGDRALVFVAMEEGEAAELAARYRGDFEGLDVAVGGPGPLYEEITDTVERDLVRSESIAFPMTLVLLVVVFGSVVAALLPLGVGAFAIVGTFLALDLIARLTEVSIFSLNLTTALGLGLGIDYALFVVSRFREELGKGRSAHEAVVRTVATAGRTVLFSAGTVMVSLIGMLVFPLPFLQSFAYAGSAVVALAALGAVVALPALLAVLGPGVNRLRVRRIHHLHTEGVWQRIANAVMRRPIPVALAAVAVLMVLGSPFLRIELGTSDERVLPASSPARAVGDILREEFATAESAALDVVAVGLADPAQIGSYAAALSGVPGVARVDAATGSYMAGMRVAEPGPASVRFLGTDATYLAVVPAVESTSAEAETLVEAIRATEAPVEVLVAGAAADLVDTKAAMFGGLWWAVGIIGAVTFVVLFLMFGSLLVPAKAVALNLLSLSATFGALVWIFQEGHLAGLLGFTPTGTLEITMPILLFAIAFGLSMDYEVFLLSRIKEEYDRTGDNERSVAVGLERTGRIVTAAALLIAVVLVAFATSQVVFMKIFGVGMTIAVLVDAFVVRATLVPAFMRLAGRANWWAPAWLAAIHRRFGISEAVEPAEEEPSGVPL